MKAKSIIVTMGALVEAVVVVTGDTSAIVDEKLPKAAKEIVEEMIEDRIMNNHYDEIEELKEMKVDKIVSTLIRGGSFPFNDAQDTEIFIIPADIWER